MASLQGTLASLLRPAARAGLQSAGIMTVADATTQLAVEERSLFVGGDKDGAPPTASDIATPYDPIRTLRWTVVGLALHGPYFFHCFGRLDRVFGPATTLAAVAKKTIAAQLIVFPPYLAALFGCLGAMEGGDVDGIASKVKHRVPEAFVSGCAFWPVANAINFACVSSAARVPYVAAVGGLWNGYLSHMNAGR